ncbi:hypothetical protein HA075_07180 [bacterium BFN5]|nr:hypothetical protein HA075_06965 [bacterium BFN5]QJW45649.1 hypothetical protein HA075_07180 [bacterium BFN5]
MSDMSEVQFQTKCVLTGNGVDKETGTISATVSIRLRLINGHFRFSIGLEDAEDIIADLIDAVYKQHHSIRLSESLTRSRIW